MKEREIQIINKVNFSEEDLDFFRQANTWQEKNKDYIHLIYLLLINGMPNSGCCICEFDGLRIIFNLFTLTEERNKGYASQIIRKVCEDSKEYLVLARSVNSDVINLFQKCGFKTFYRNSSSVEILGNTNYA